MRLNGLLANYANYGAEIFVRIQGIALLNFGHRYHYYYQTSKNNDVILSAPLHLAEWTANRGSGRRLNDGLC